ncbi:MAG: ATP-binding cassette domain-containing protein [Pseudomonadota bacterium]
MDAIVAANGHDLDGDPTTSDTDGSVPALLSALNVWLITRRGDTERHVLSNCSLTVRPDEIVSIEGRPQSGRPEFMAILAGFETPTRGTVLFEDGPLINPMGGVEATRRRRQIGHLFAAGMLLPGLSATENVRAVLEGLHQPDQTGETLEREAIEALRRAGFDGDPDVPVSTLGRPMRIRVGLATSLVKKPKILLCDAPADGLSKDDAAALFDQFDALRRDKGLAIVHATVDTGHAARADRQFLLEHGRLRRAEHQS